MANFIILIILHLLGDFYLQTAKISKCKNAKIDDFCGVCVKCKHNSKLNIKYIFIHMILYIIPFFALFFMTKWLIAIKTIIVIGVTHGIIDIIACVFNKKCKKTLVLFIDQFLHVGSLFIIYKLISFDCCLDDYFVAIKTAFTVLLLMVPCSVLVNKLFEDIFSENQNTGIFDIGSIIGILERFLVIIFAYFENFAAIAIIITVKTWARTNDLEKPEFRNKYLLGTLASLVLSLFSYILFKLI